MPSKAFQKLSENRQDVNLLWHAQKEMLGKKHKLTAKSEVINRASLVFITAFWEAYLEDLVEQSFHFLLDDPQGSSVIPRLLKAKIADNLLASSSKLQIWDLADDGWKILLNDHKQKILEDRLESFHSPKSEKVRELFSDLLGIRDITRCWQIGDMSSTNLKSSLDEFIYMRGNIAHRVKHDAPVSKAKVRNFLTLVEKLSILTDNATHNHLKTLTGREPWEVINESPLVSITVQ